MDDLYAAYLLEGAMLNKNSSGIIEEYDETINDKPAKLAKN